MDLQSMRFFVSTADAGSFSAAAEKLSYAQSNLSTRIRLLEEELGEPLFYRGRKGVTLTAKGQVFYEYALQLLRLSEEAVNAVQNLDEPRGRLRIGSLEAIVLEDLPELMSAYHGRFPDVKLMLHTDMNEKLQSLVLDRSMDGAFIAGPTSNPDLIEIPFSVKHLILVGSAKEKERPAESILTEAPLITFPEGSIFRHRFEMLLSSYSSNYQNRLHVMNSLSANIVNICAGIGYGYLTKSGSAFFIAQGLMREYKIYDPYSELNIIFVYRRDRVMDAAFVRFLEMVDAFRK